MRIIGFIVNSPLLVFLRTEEYIFTDSSILNPRRLGNICHIPPKGYLCECEKEGGSEQGEHTPGPWSCASRQSELEGGNSKRDLNTGLTVGRLADVPCHFPHDQQ